LQLKFIVLKIFSFAVLISLVSSCAFNNMFYHPNVDAVSTPPDAISEYITYGESDSIHTLFYANESAKASIFFLHGNAGNLGAWSEVADLFYQANYQVFIIDYPGFGNSSNKAKHKAVFESTQLAVEHFKTLPGVRDSKKLLMGYSLGGNLAVKVGFDNPNTFDAMLIEGAFESHKTIAIDRVTRPFKFAPALIVKDAVKGKKLIANWNKPLLVIHSTQDATCDYEMGKTLYESAIGTTQKELWTIKGPHLAGIGLNFEEYLEKVAALVEAS
jgi:pimeloyl-ACP methyl ester carboxylesterase